MKESAVASHVRLAAAQMNIQLWRNNVGVAVTEHGRHIRYGLGNISEAFNKVVASSDYIGITPVLITPDMVGLTVGVFTAIETKSSDWRMIPSDKRALAQLAFIDIVKQAGGYAGFAQTVEEFKRIINR